LIGELIFALVRVIILLEGCIESLTGLKRERALRLENVLLWLRVTLNRASL
jgi:hypothetical protein